MTYFQEISQLLEKNDVIPDLREVFGELASWMDELKAEHNEIKYRLKTLEEGRV